MKTYKEDRLSGRRKSNGRRLTRSWIALGVVSALAVASCTGSSEPVPSPDPTVTSTVEPIEPAIATPTVTTATKDESDRAVAASGCTPPRLLALDEIPTNPTLDSGPGVLAVFEVDGDDLVGKYVGDPAVAEGALALWQEVVLRIPTNQRLDLVEFNVYAGSDPAGYIDGTATQSATGRYGFTLGLSADHLTLNQSEPCAPLEGRRGTFDWTLVHEFAHMRQRVDGVIDDYTATFQGGEPLAGTYPEDGSPSLVGDFVSSYAERSAGDEDAAETWTTFVMLDDLPPLQADEPLVMAKLRWMAEQPGYAALRSAIRLTESDGDGGVAVDPAPRLGQALAIAPPGWILGTWQAAVPAGVFPAHDQIFVFAPDDITSIVSIDGVELDRRVYSTLDDSGTVVAITQLTGEMEYVYTLMVAGDAINDSFFARDDGSVSWSRGDGGPQDTVLTRVEE